MSLACAAAWLVLGAAVAPPAQAQALCSSDGRAAPRTLLERFLSADCADCWRARDTPRAGPGALVVDWVLPGAQGDDAPLSAVARLDSQWRAAALGQVVRGTAQRTAVRAPQVRQALRVAHGLPFNGYLGVSLRISLPLVSSSPGPWRAVVVLIEMLPEGTENSPVARNLARNSLERAWEQTDLLSNSKQLQESRVMAIPEGADPQRLAVVAWVEDPKGRLLATAVADCRAPE